MRPDAAELKQRQAELRELYLKLWPKFTEDLRKIPKERKVSKPLLLNITAHEYAAARTRLLIVGQQTNDFEYDKDWNQVDVDYLLGVYKNYELGAKDMNRAFWQASHELYSDLNPDGPRNGFLWTNLFKVEENNHRPGKDVEELLFRAFNVLSRELELSQPDVMVFFTGHNKDAAICCAFPGAEFVVASPHEPREVLARITDPSERLPKHTYRTCHPTRLRIKKKWPLLKSIASLVGSC